MSVIIQDRVEGTFQCLRCHNSISTIYVSDEMFTLKCHQCLQVWSGTLKQTQPGLVPRKEDEQRASFIERGIA